jgi:broad specificity phosphatase PhoE
MALKLLVLRHGETDSVRERRFTGWRDVPLTDGGRRQCEAAARALEGTIVAAIYASPLDRTRTSAEIVAKPHLLDVRVDPAFREIGFGDWEGLTRDEAAARYPEAWQVWRTAPSRFVAPGGEPLAAVAQRVAAGVEALRTAHDGQTVVLVTHAIVTRLIVLAALGLGPDRLWSVDASPAGLSELEYREDWVTVHRVNTLAHLAADEATP